jgi:hypothetical protein
VANARTHVYPWTLTAGLIRTMDSAYTETWLLRKRFVLVRHERHDDHADWGSPCPCCRSSCARKVRTPASSVLLWRLRASSRIVAVENIAWKRRELLGTRFNSPPGDFASR